MRRAGKLVGLTGDVPGSVLLGCKERDFRADAAAKAPLQQLWLLSMEVLVLSLSTCIVQHLSFASRGDFGCYMCAWTCTRAKLDLSVTDREQGLPPAAQPSMLCARGSGEGCTRWPRPWGKDLLETASATVAVW